MMSVRNRGLAAALVLTLSVSSLVGGRASDASENALTVALDLNPGLTRKTALHGNLEAAGIFSNPLTDFPLQGPNYVILSTGRASDAFLWDDNNDEQLGADSAWDDLSTGFGGRAMDGTWDLVQLTVKVQVPAWARSFAFDFAFLTEEWPDYYGSRYNDTFVVQMGPSELSLSNRHEVYAPGNLVFDASGTPISVNSGYGLDPNHPNPDTGTAYDGSTGLLTTVVPIPTDMRELTLTFSLFDVADPILDTAVFLDNLRFLTTEVSTPVTRSANSVPGAPSFPDRGDPTDSPPSAGFGFMTGGGQTVQSPAPNLFGGNVMERRGEIRGQWQHVSGVWSFASTQIDTLVFETVPGDGPGVPFSSYNAATFTGRGELNGVDGYTFEVRVVDRGEPGLLDTYGIRVLAVDGTLAFREEGVLSGGNLQVHAPQP